MKQENATTGFDMKQFFGFIWPYLRPYPLNILMIIVTFFLVSVLTALQPLVVAPILDVVIGNDQIYGIDPESASLTFQNLDLNNLSAYVMVKLGLFDLSPWDIVLALSGAYLFVSVILHLISYFNMYISIRLRVVTRVDLQEDLYAHMTDLSLDFYNRQRTGDLMTRLENDTRNALGGMETLVRDLIVAPIMILIYGYLMIKTDLRLTGIIVGAAMLQYILTRILRNPLKNRALAQKRIVADVTSYLQEMFGGMRILKTFVAEAYERNRLADLLKKARKANIRFGLIKYIDQPITGILNSITNLAILYLVARELFQGNLTTTGFFLYLYVGRAILGPVNQMGYMINSIQNMLVSGNRVQEIFDDKPTIVSGKKKFDQFEKNVVFDSVSFKYLDDAVLQTVSFEIKKGEMVALVGPSGAGKTTITDLLLRFYDPEEGAILLDGTDIREVDLSQFRSLYGAVAQESFLFNATVAENIAYARPDITREEIIAASKVANAHEFINQMPDGYDTFVGDRGVLLSGGQRQRIAIARAVVRDPQILILDEATSSLDSVSERLVQEAIDRVIQNSTAIVIAHRLSTVRNADKIVVMEAGAIVDVGKHDELYKRCALYKELSDLQFGTAS